MQVSFSIEDLRPIIEATVREVLAQTTEDESKMPDRIAFDEEESARLLSLERHQLRDERLRGRISATTIVGKRIRYLRSDLIDYLARHRAEARDE